MKDEFAAIKEYFLSLSASGQVKYVLTVPLLFFIILPCYICEQIGKYAKEFSDFIGQLWRRWLVSE